jgi:YidC/Oxa1 family membrane protein insertase
LIELIGFLWQTLLEKPMINLLIILSEVFGGSFGLAILGLTVIIRGLTMPLTMKQLHSSKALQQLQPRMQELQKKYKDPKRRSEETMRLYKEAGVNPFGCLLPMIVQFPIWIALYRALTVTVGGTRRRNSSTSRSCCTRGTSCSRRSRWLRTSSGWTWASRT